jgi:hypothetical protein
MARTRLPSIKTRQAQEFAARILDSEAYRTSLELRAKNGSLPPAVETMLWHYAYGKPVETVHLLADTDSADQDLTELSDAQLAALAQDRARTVVTVLQEAGSHNGRAVAGELLAANLPEGQKVQ